MYFINNTTQVTNFSKKTSTCKYLEAYKKLMNLNKRTDSTKQGSNIIFLIFHFYSSNPFDDFHVLTKN